MNDLIWKSKEYWTQKAIGFNPKLKEIITFDPDYCVRGMIYDPEINMYAEFSGLAAILNKKDEENE